MSVKINRYDAHVTYGGEGKITDLKYGEIIVVVKTRNRELTRKLIDLCYDELDKGNLLNEE